MKRNKENTIIYQIYPKSFQDTNGDGIGDIRGMIQRLDYIASLSIDMIWITPIFASPMHDNGYDVSDYRAINPLFGTMDDLELLIVEAGKQNIAIMLDMVFNHTSTEHYWFKEALKGNAEYMDYYIFSDSKTNWESKFGGNAWEYVPTLNKYYLHLFDVTQADLNWNNPKVRRELYDIVNFWIEKGIKGFRFDVINLISKPQVFVDDDQGDGRRFYTDGPKVHEYLQELNRETFGKYEDIITVGEMSSTNIKDCALYSNNNGKELSMVFSFHHLKVDYQDGNKWQLEPFIPQKLYDMWREWQGELSKQLGWNALFLNNHDQPRSVERFGNLDYHYESATALATALFLMKGTPFIYQGEEIGLPNANYETLANFRDIETLNYISSHKNIKTDLEMLTVLNQRSRDNGRTPMIWDNTLHHGFSNTEPWLPFSQSKSVKSVADASNDKASILSYYQELIALRKQVLAFQNGDIEFLDVEHPNLFIYNRTHGDETYRVITNLTAHLEEVKLDALYDVVLSNYNRYKGQDVIQMMPYMTIVLKKKTQ